MVGQRELYEKGKSILHIELFYVFQSVHENFNINDRNESTAINQFNKIRGLLTSPRFILYNWMPKSKRKYETIELSQKTRTVNNLNKDTGRPREQSLHQTGRTDKFIFDSTGKSTSLPVTLRTFLSIIASLCVVIDFMTLITVYFEFMVQEICQLKPNRNDQARFEFVKCLL